MCQAAYQLALLLVLSIRGAEWFNVPFKSLTHNTIVFNSFIFCQVFNEYTARSIGDGMNPFAGIFKNSTFLYVSITSVIFQALLVEFGGSFVGTAPLPIITWLITIGLGAIGLIIGVFMRLIPVKEDPNSFFDSYAAMRSERDDYSIAINDNDSLKPKNAKYQVSKILPAGSN